MCTNSNDNRLAKGLNGVWEYQGIDPSDNEPIAVVYSFVYDEKAESNFGKLIEEQSYTYTLSEISDGVKFGVKSKISGEWKVQNGYLYFTYDLASLVIDILDLETFGLPEEQIEDESYAESLEVLKTMLKDKIYDSTYEQFRTDNTDNLCFRNLIIEGDNLSFEAGDLGHVAFIKRKS